MCGIIGVCNFNGKPVSIDTIKEMTSVIDHRGPDGDGFYCDGPIGLGHRRLAIIDLSPTGKQPIQNETGDIFITYNGELFNYIELRKDLVAKGHKFYSHTDTEVVVHAYEEWGESCLEKFNGQFAFGIWDKNSKTLFLARDRFGVNPLYFFYDQKKFVFASEIKAIIRHPGINSELSYEALAEYFTFQNILGDHTLFKHIHLLQAGHYIKVDLSGYYEKKRYWDFPKPGTMLDIPKGDAVEELIYLFRQAVKRQLMSDVPVGSYLSGGMDSGSITTIAQEELGDLTTFTCGFDLSSVGGIERNFDERAHAEELSKNLNTEHYEVFVHAGDMERIMPNLIWHLEDLRVGQSYPNYYVSKLAGKFVKVVMAGTGGDELFAGYPWRYFPALKCNNEEEFLNQYHDYWQRLVPDKDKSMFFTEEVFGQLTSPSTKDLFRSVIRGSGISLNNPEDYINASLYFELKTFLHGLLLVENKLSMAHSLETRVPFLDNDLVDFSIQLPLKHKLNIIKNHDRLDTIDVKNLRTNDGKVILREVMSRFIPDKITSRAKQGFSAPDASWFRNETLGYIDNLLRCPNAEIYQVINPDYVQKRLNSHKTGVMNERLFIWSLLSFEWWLKVFKPSL
ncbi:asparagine synthase (glutamine-hydrolyzing) [Chloroflexota bacterium]